MATATVKPRGPVLLSREEAAEYLGVAPHTLAVWATTGRYKLPFVKVGRFAHYRPADLDKFLANGVKGFSSDE